MDILFASPECTHHSRARGGKPINDQSRATAYCVHRWADALRPSVIIVENVQEFQEWGPIGSDGKPLKSRKGELFRAWLATLAAQGYKVEYRILCAADYGVPTTRERLFVQAVRGRRKIAWPAPTHSAESEPDMWQTLKLHRSAREIIDWEKPSRSIYLRKKPLSPKTMQRIFRGLEKFGMPGLTLSSEPQPYIVAWDNHGGNGDCARAIDAPLSTVVTKARHGVAQPYLIKLRGTKGAQLDGSAQSIDSPLPTVTAGGRHIAVCTPRLVKQAGQWTRAQPFIVPAQSCGAPRSTDKPVPTITTTTRGMGLAQPFLIKYYGSGGAVSIDRPLDTVTTNDRFALVQPMIEIEGETYLIDIHFRMLGPRELARAQGFPDTYQFAGNSTEAVKQIGNAVPVQLAEALMRAQIEAGNI